MSGTSADGIMLAILAAGSSRRFGDQDKLEARLNDKMLGLHIAKTLAPLKWSSQYVIVPSSDHPCATEWTDFGYDLLVNEHAKQGQSTSVKLAASTAAAHGASALCICLADMPFVSADHVRRLRKAFTDGHQIVASDGGVTPAPPAIFHASQLAALDSLEGDQGARKLLKEAHLVRVDRGQLVDVDTIDDLTSIVDNIS